MTLRCYNKYVIVYNKISSLMSLNSIYKSNQKNKLVLAHLMRLPLVVLALERFIVVCSTLFSAEVGGFRAAICVARGVPY